MDTIFNVVMLKHGDDSILYVKEPLDDFIDHLSTDVKRIDIQDYSNCVVVQAECKNGDTLKLVYDSTMFNKSTIVAVPNTLYMLLQHKELGIGWEYQNRLQEFYDYKKLLTKENTDRVIALRKELVQLPVEKLQSVYPHLSYATKKALKNGSFVAKSDYEVKCAFMDAIRGEYEMVTMRPMLFEGGKAQSKLTYEEQRVLDARPKTAVPFRDEPNEQVQTYFVENKNLYMKDFFAKPKIVPTKKKAPTKTNPQRSLDDFTF